MARTVCRAMGIAVGLGALLVAGATAAQEQPRRGGTLSFAVNADPPSYDCINTTTFVAVQTLNPHYSQLLKFDPDNYPNVKGDLAGISKRIENSASSGEVALASADLVRHDTLMLVQPPLKPVGTAGNDRRPGGNGPHRGRRPARPWR